MILSKHPLVLPLFLIAAAINFNPAVASAVTAFETANELKAAVDLYCGGDTVDSKYG